MKKFNSLVTLQEGISHKLYLWISSICFIPHLGCQSERVPSQCYGKLKGSNEKSFSDKLLLGPFRKALWQSQGVCRGAEQWYFKCAQLGLGYNKQPFWTASQALNPMCVYLHLCLHWGTSSLMMTPSQFVVFWSSLFIPFLNPESSNSLLVFAFSCNSQPLFNAFFFFPAIIFYSLPTTFQSPNLSTNLHSSQHPPFLPYLALQSPTQ